MLHTCRTCRTGFHLDVPSDWRILHSEPKDTGDWWIHIYEDAEHVQHWVLTRHPAT